MPKRILETKNNSGIHHHCFTGDSHWFDYFIEMRQEDLENRQFQLERLAEEGKPLCEEIHQNNERLLYSSEGLSEEEKLEVLEKIIQEEEEKQQPRVITRRQFLMGCGEIRNHWETAIIGAQIQLRDIDKILESERANRALGAKMTYFVNPDGSFTFHAEEKNHVGFKEPKKKKPKKTDAKVWAETLRERQAKKDGRTGTDGKT